MPVISEPSISDEAPCTASVASSAGRASTRDLRSPSPSSPAAAPGCSGPGRSGPGRSGRAPPPLLSPPPPAPSHRCAHGASIWVSTKSATSSENQ
eukprot:scaffold108955_cov63-Phaeocystis_antarctica.AAC.1